VRGILIFIIVFGILVFVHEFGHFMVAKWSGILVREFSIGMGPKLFQFRGQQTTYTIRWLPLGGYVRLAGSDDESKLDPGMNIVVQLNDAGKVKRIDASESDLPISGLPIQVKHADLVDSLKISGFEAGDENKAVTYDVDHDATIIDQKGTELVIAPRDTQFQQANVWQKLATNFAGPFMNIVLGFVVFMLWTFTAPGPATTTIAKVSPNSPAQAAQIKAGDRFLKIDGKETQDFDMVSKLINASDGKKVRVELQTKTGPKTAILKPQAKTVDHRQVYEIGIMAKTDERAGVKAKRGWQTSVATTGLIFNAVGNLFRHFSLNKLSGPVGIYSQTSQVSQMGFSYILAFLAMISINLGIVNLIPIPGLDGGKLLLNLIQLVRGKPISEDHEAAVEFIGFLVLLILIIAVTGNDIYRYFIK
jgi:regulator of sigma E protease